MTDLAAARTAHANAARALATIVRETPVPGLSHLTLALEHLGWLLNQAEEYAAELAAVLADRDETGQRNVTLASELGAARAEIERLSQPRSVLRCGSCDHDVTDHAEEGGCWYTVTVGSPDRDLVCPCSVSRREHLRDRAVPDA